MQHPSFMEGAYPSRQGPGAPHRRGALQDRAQRESRGSQADIQGAPGVQGPLSSARQRLGPLSAPQPGDRGPQARWGPRVATRWTRPWKGATHRTGAPWGPVICLLGQVKANQCATTSKSSGPGFGPQVLPSLAGLLCASLSLEQRPAQGCRLASMSQQVDSIQGQHTPATLWSQRHTPCRTARISRNGSLWIPPPVPDPASGRCRPEHPACSPACEGPCTQRRGAVPRRPSRVQSGGSESPGLWLLGPLRAGQAASARRVGHSPLLAPSTLPSWPAL